MNGLKIYNTFSCVYNTWVLKKNDFIISSIKYIYFKENLAQDLDQILKFNRFIFNKWTDFINVYIFFKNIGS